MPKLLVLTLALVLWTPAILCWVTTERELTVLEGQSLVLPCPYEPQYASYVKYWCRGSTRELCSSLARTDDTRVANPAEDKVSIFDDPVLLVVSVTMNNLTVADTGWYMCGVEIGGVWTADVVTFTNIKVIHGLSVDNTQLSGEEGSSVTFECLYSVRYRESEKKWCRSGDCSSCLTTGSEGSYDDASVAINDDRTRTLTITLKKLQLRDTGWYWCSAGQHKIFIHVLVTPRPTTTAVSVTSPLTPSQSVAHLPPPKSITKQSWNSRSLILESLLVCSSLMILSGLVILARRLWRLHRPQYPSLEQDAALRQFEEEKAKINKYSLDAGDLQNTAVVVAPQHEVPALSPSHPRTSQQGACMFSSCSRKNQGGW